MDVLDKVFGHYYSTFVHLDTVKLRILLSLKLEEMDFLEVKIEGGKCIVDGVALMDVSNVSEFTNNKYLAKLQEELVETKAAEAETTRINNAFQKIYENVEFKEMPEKELEAFKNEFVSYYEEMAKYYNMTLTELISQLGSNEDEFYYYADVAAKSSLEQDLIIFSIANAQGIWKDMKKADYDEYIANQAELYDTDVKTIEEQDGAETIWKYLISDKTMEYVLANAVEVEPTAEEDTAETIETVDEK
jgi:FKBP-type peptidyl-prolyl cis-trans isomerase (trigger factor)